MENMRKTGLKAMKGAVDWGSVKHSMEGLNANIDRWVENKAPLMEAFRRHPDWNEGALSVIKEVVETEEASPARAKECLKEICQSAFEHIQEQDELQQYGIEQNMWSSEVPASCETVRRLSNVPSEVLMSANFTRELIGMVDPKLPCPPSVGMKVTRFIVKNLLAADVDVTRNAEIASYISDLCDARRSGGARRLMVFSLNPADYLLMSNGNSWSSCHAFWNEGRALAGSYGTGALSLMGDGATVVGYIPRYISHDLSLLWKEKKLKRQLFHVHADSGKIFVQSRLYPDSDRYAPLYRMFRRELHEILSSVYGFKNYWKAPLGGSRGVLVNLNGYYADHNSGIPIRTSCELAIHERVASGELNHSILVGGIPLCVLCGERTIAGCSDVAWCRPCSEREKEKEGGS